MLNIAEDNGFLINLNLAIKTDYKNAFRALSKTRTKRPFGCNFIFNMEAPYLTDMELKSEYKAVVR